MGTSINRRVLSAAWTRLSGIHYALRHRHASQQALEERPLEVRKAECCGEAAMAAVLLCRPKHTRLSQPGLRFTSRSHGFIASALQTRSLCSRVPARQSLVHDEVESEELEALRSGLKVGLHGPHHLIPA